MCVEAFYIRLMREPRELLQEVVIPDRDDPFNSQFQQTVFYIGGSVVHSIKQLGKKSSSEKWQKILNCVELKLVSDNSAEGQMSSVSRWQSSLDRGGLVYISDTLWLFLMAFTGLLKDKEEKDGSIRKDVVLRCVKEDMCLASLWEEVVQGLLPEEESNELREHVCKLFLNAWGSGIALRRKNTLREIGKDKVAFRSTMLSK